MIIQSKNLIINEISNTLVNMNSEGFILNMVTYILIPKGTKKNVLILIFVFFY